MEMEVLNFNQICRTCKQYSPQMRSVFEGFENPHQSPRIDEMLMAFASVQVGVHNVLEFFVRDQNIAKFSIFNKFLMSNNRIRLIQDIIQT